MKKLFISGTKKLAVFGTLFVVCGYGILVGLESFGIHVGIVEVGQPRGFAHENIAFSSTVDVETDAFMEADAAELLAAVDVESADDEATVGRAVELPADPFAAGALQPPSEWGSLDDGGRVFQEPEDPEVDALPLETSEVPNPVADPTPVEPDEREAPVRELANGQGAGAEQTVPALDRPDTEEAGDLFDFQTRLKTGGQPAAMMDEADRFAAFDQSGFTEFEGAQFQRERVWVLVLDLHEKLTRFGDRHPQVIQARKALEHEVRRGLQVRHKQQVDEISRLRERLGVIEKRLSERAERENELVASLLTSLIASVNSPENSLIGPPKNGADLALTPGGAGIRWVPEQPFGGYGSAGASAGFGGEVSQSDAASELLKQITVRVKWQYEANPRFIDLGEFDAVLLADRGLIVSALPEKLTTEEASTSLELTILYPATRTMTDARLVAVDDQTGLAVLEPDLLPDDTPGVELNFDEIATGDRIFVATVVDSQLTLGPEVETVSGHARRLVGKPRTISRLATDFQSRPGLGGAPLLSEDGRLGGIMSAREPGQYIGAAGIARMLETTGRRDVGNEEDDGSTLKQTFEPSQPADSVKVSSEGLMQPKVLLDRVLQLHRDISEAKFDIQQAEQKLALYESLSKANAVSSSDLETARLNASRAHAKLKLLLQHAEAWRTHSTLSDRYAYALLEVAKAEYEMAVQANRKVPDAVSEGEVRKLELEVERFELELRLVAQTLELLKEAEIEAKADGAANAAPDTAPSDSAAGSVVPSERQSGEATAEEADSATPAEKTPTENGPFETQPAGSDPFSPSTRERTKTGDPAVRDS